MNKISKKLGQNLKKIRTQKGISQGDISRKLDMDRGYISRLENGMKNPTLSTIQKIADFLGVGIDDLIK
jgi:transcriptional regulator with XRE-family HTH domain